MDRVTYAIRDKLFDIVKLIFFMRTNWVWSIDSLRVYCYFKIAASLFKYWIRSQFKFLRTARNSGSIRCMCMSQFIIFFECDGLCLGLATHRFLHWLLPQLCNFIAYTLAIWVSLEIHRVSTLYMGALWGFLLNIWFHGSCWLL